ncbi:MAG: tripartite tricarboxylate transporter substrate binding protein [Burkholderiales bacterium]|nr:tripartite tricarboxylate transporter substrate binding protein [Burkholderiales bacterium]
MRASLGMMVIGLLLGLQTQPAPAQNFPVKQVRWIVPFPPGGAADISSRVIGQKLAERWGQQVIVDNRPGAGGNLGTELAARAAPDGYTVVLVPATFTTYPSLARKPLFDPVKDFAPITLVSSSPLMLVVHPSLPVKNVRELVALARARPDQLNYASSGIGASAHMAAELFKSATKTRIVHVPYKGQPPAIVDLVAGQVQLMFPNIPSVQAQIKAGRLRPLAVTTAGRSVLFPEMPTVAEAGVPDFEVTQWGGLVTAAGTPAAIVGKFQKDLSAVLSQPDVKQSLLGHGFEAVGSTPAQFAEYIRVEIAKWAKIIREAGIRAE